jgi:hypothetical protein
MGKKNHSKYDNKFVLGQMFGNYKIIDNNITIEREAKVVCQCTCGNTSKVSCYSLIKGTSTQCSTCGNSLKKDKNPAWKGFGDVSGKTLSKLKRDAKTRDIEFNITIEELDDKLKSQEYKCKLTGLELSTNYKDLTASVDRIDSSKGYSIDNVQWVHKDINMMKNDYDEDYFIKMCGLVINNNLLTKIL